LVLAIFWDRSPSTWQTTWLGFNEAYALNQCDHENSVAYLESSNPKNIPFYQRHGFELLGTIQVGTSPPNISGASQAGEELNPAFHCYATNSLPADNSKAVF
jgi:hypothetical protein